MQEETTATAPAATPDSPEAAPPEPEAQAQQPETETEPEAQAEETWDALQERIQANEALKSGWDGHNQELRGEVYTEAFNNLRSQYDAATTAHAKSQELSQKAHQGVTALLGRLKKSVEEEGTLTEDALTNAFGRSPDAWSALQIIGEQSQQQARETGAAQGSWNAAHYFVTQGANSLGKPDLAKKYSVRVAAGIQGNDTAESITQDFLKEVRGIGEEAGYRRGLKEGQGGTVEAAKAGVRGGQGADMTTKGGGGRSDEELLADPSTPISKLMEIRARQKAG